MITKYNFPISKISWIKRGGIAKNYFEPENQEELINLIKSFNNNGSPFIIVGHTSNIYFKNSYNIENFVTTKSLDQWEINVDEITCLCGTKTSRFAREMVKLGYEGFEGLIDLPGTIGGAIYGNAGCYGCEISDNVISVKILTPLGVIKEFTKEDLGFSKRQSYLKLKEQSGVILSVTFKKRSGNSQILSTIAENNHLDRISHAPSPANNLGTTYYDLGRRTSYGRVIQIIGGIYDRTMLIPAKLAQLLRFSNAEKYFNILKCNRWKFEYILAGGSGIRYLHSINRFIWKDKDADEVFMKYQNTITKLYKCPKLEIEILL